MDRKTFTQQLSLRLIPEFVKNNGGDYLNADEENIIVTNIQRLVDKIYKKCELNDENTNKIEKYRYRVSNEYIQ